MFYVVNTKGSFLFGYLQQGKRESIMYEGQLIQGEPKITKRLEYANRTTHEAWECMCQMISEARADGYRDMPIDASKLQVPADLYQEEFPLVLRGVYAHVRSMTSEQFSSGLARVRAVHEAISHAGVEVISGDDDSYVELRLGAAVTSFGFVSEQLWETMTTKARELCEARGMLGDNLLLPDGRGLVHLQTRESTLDLYVRAFLQGAMKAGAVIELSSDHSWSFNQVSPFNAADLQDLQWYQETPWLLSSILKLDQTIPVQEAEVITALDFYC